MNAVVVGGSMAGLLAARVLADHFDRVTLIERDRYPQEPAFRSGVPHARHTHTMLARGRQALEQLFPGIDTELATAGAPNIRWGTADLRAWLPGGWLPPYETQVETRAASRALLDFVIRRRLTAIKSVHFLEEQRVTGLRLNAHRNRVAGVRLQDRSIEADLVVDASGRSSRLPEWLASLDYPQPAESRVDSRLGYATRWYRLPAASERPWKYLIVQSAPPRQPRGGAALLMEQDRFVVTLDSAAGDYPPTDERGFLEFARSLAAPDLYHAITARGAEPLSPINGYRLTQNQLRHYDRMPCWPAGLVVLGDAVCALNPLYGQGMTVAALGALALRDLLRECDLACPRLARRFQQRLARLCKAPWMMATGEDFRYPGTEGERPGIGGNLMHWYTDQLYRMLPYDADLIRRFARVVNLLETPASLMRPATVARVLWHACAAPLSARA